MGTADSIDMGGMRDFIERSFELMYTYRFIFLHFVEIDMRMPSIREAYYALTQRREREFLSVFEKLRAEGVFRADLPASVLQTLVTQIFIVGGFWLSNNELTVRLKGKKAIAHYSGVFFNMLYPYLATIPTYTQVYS